MSYQSPGFTNYSSQYKLLQFITMNQVSYPEQSTYTWRESYCHFLLLPSGEISFTASITLMHYSDMVFDLPTCCTYTSEFWGVIITDKFWTKTHPFCVCVHVLVSAWQHTTYCPRLFSQYHASSAALKSDSFDLQQSSTPLSSSLSHYNSSNISSYNAGRYKHC